MSRRILLFSVLLALAGPTPAADCPRIVSQSPYITRALDWLGLSPCIVGVSRYDERELPRTGGVMDPDADTIALLDPQLMITSDWTKPEVWQAAAPPSARALRVGGFRSMAEVEAMLRDIGRAANLADIDARVDRFAADWRAAAKRVDGHGRRVLIIAACGGVPYSYGRRTTPYDLISQAGFTVVESHETLRHLRAGEPYETIAQLVAATRPEAVVALINTRSPSCNAQLAEARVPIIAVNDDKFVHPGPGLIEALEQLGKASHE
jgi:iron complex transport system substrate-binding protein